MTGFASPEVNRVVRLFFFKIATIVLIRKPFHGKKKTTFLSTVRKLPLANVTPINVIK